MVVFTMGKILCKNSDLTDWQGTAQKPGLGYDGSSPAAAEGPAGGVRTDRCEKTEEFFEIGG
jgi:hypothetical protein